MAARRSRERYIPQFDLSNFDNHFSAGVWELVIQDDSEATGRAHWLNSSTGRSRFRQPATNSGLGEVVADQATVGFRIFTQDPTNPLAVEHLDGRRP